MPLQPIQLRELVGRWPGAVLENDHVPIGGPIVEASGAQEGRVVNLPGAGRGLLDVVGESGRRITAALGQ